MENEEIFITIAQPLTQIGDRHVHDNRVEGVNLPPQAFDAKDYLPDYYSAKFSYFAGKLTLLYPELADSLPQGSSHAPPTERLRAIWDQTFTDECKAYLLRVSQLPADAVHVAWYNDTPEFLLWASLLRRLGAQKLAHGLTSEFPVDLDRERETVEGLAALTRQFASVVSLDDAQFTSLAGVRTEHNDGVVGELTTMLSSLMADPEADYEWALTQVVAAIRDAYGVRICDLMRVTMRNLEHRLEVLVSSSPSPIEDVRAAEFHYRFAEGITGSTFLLAKRDPHGWVGTDKLSLDPRGGRKHEDAFKHVYGPVESFWVFPIFSQNGLEGALRVIDVAPNALASTSNSEALSYTSKAELAFIADWLGSVMAFLGAVLPGTRQEGAVAKIARMRREASDPSETPLSWVPLRFFKSLLSDLSQLALVRSEHKPIECLVAIGTHEGLIDLRNDSRAYVSIPDDQRSGRLKDAAGLFARVLPGSGVFLCGVPEADAGDAHDVLYDDVVATSHLQPEVVAENYGPIAELSFVHVDGTRGLLRFYEGGAVVADYYLNEKTGAWQFRPHGDLTAQILEALPDVLPRVQLDAVVRQTIDYSYEGHGGLVVVAGEREIRHVISRDGFVVDQPLRSMDARVFASVASVDGGTWVDVSSMRVKQAGILFLNDELADSMESGGARHKAALSVWRQLSVGLVLAVSANRAISAYACYQESGQRVEQELKF